MKKLCLAVVILLVVPAQASSYKRMMLVGDSWATLMCFNQSFDDAFRLYGLNVMIDGCYSTSKIGMHASRWLGQKVSQQTEKILKSKSIDVIYLSLGGNDFLASWNKLMTETQEIELFLKIKNDVKLIIEHLRSIRPQVKILLSGYDFGRFTNNHPIKNYRELYEDMGGPTPLELNAAALRMSEVMNELRDNEHVFYIHHYGLMHYYYGNPDGRLEPGATLPPDFISPPENPNQSGGELSLNQYYRSMFSINQKWTDAYHLSANGFLYVALHSTDMYLAGWLGP